MALIAGVGHFTSGAFWVEGGRLLNPCIKDKRHNRVTIYKVGHAKPQSNPLDLFNTRPLHGPMPWQAHKWSVIFYTAGGLPQSPPHLVEVVVQGFKLPYFGAQWLS